MLTRSEVLTRQSSASSLVHPRRRPVPDLDLLTYRVPDGMDAPAVGARVVVPLGARTVTGIVVENRAAGAAGIDPRSIKPIRQMLDAERVRAGRRRGARAVDRGVLRGRRRRDDHRRAAAEDPRRARRRAQDRRGRGDHRGGAGGDRARPAPGPMRRSRDEPREQRCSCRARGGAGRPLDGPRWRRAASARTRRAARQARAGRPAPRSRRPRSVRGGRGRAGAARTSPGS